jgi:hypothetical protein
MTAQRKVMGERKTNEGKRNANLKHMLYKI